MQQEKMGCLLRKLRKEKGLTQEQMAELFRVTNRTVSRWENGKNMPDISVLVEISNYFEIDILELIEGERKNEKMNTENDNALETVANYAEKQKDIILKNVRRLDVVGIVCCTLSCLAMELNRFFENKIFIILQVVFLGITLGMLMWNVSYSTGISNVINRIEKKHTKMKYWEILLVIILVLWICWDIYVFYLSLS